MPTWLITGCSSGLGRHLAEAVLARGWNAVVTARTLAAVEHLSRRFPDTALALPLDVRDRARSIEAVQQAEARFGTVDVLVNNAGYGYRAAVEEASDADVTDLFATNFFGAIALIKAVLPRMRAKRRGAIVNISSIGGRRSPAGSGYYAASKFAIEGLSDALRKEVGPLGIKVIVIEPGAFRTDFAGRSLLQSETTIGDYAKTAGLRRKEVDTMDGRQQGDPARGAEAIIDVVGRSSWPFRLLLGSDAIQIIRSELDDQRAELDAWESVSLSTDFQS
jgi:NAD(P)-dependent dehydrogenase (short-subunit alcohol dehydrogenase family)